ncbi:MAG TPA: phosphatase PAP2 family protein [Stellaceae bacterium]|nr:phosphatase PAP2 family protein [Stellaceae bacterium]
MNLLVLITGLGDAALLLPASAGILLWLTCNRCWRAAAWWLVAFALCTGAIALLKIYFGVCSANPDLRSPSGHACLSALVYGSLLGIAGMHIEARQRYCVAAAGAALLLGIGWSRVALGAHSVIETLIGMGIGLAGMAAFLAAYRNDAETPRPVAGLLLAAILLGVLFHGQALHAEPLLHWAGSYLRSALGTGCVTAHGGAFFIGFEKASTAFY